MKSRLHKVLKNQRGSVINVALLILILIFLVAIGLHKISTTDIKIASNLKTQATTFYEAEAGLDAASELVELNVQCPLGFKGGGPSWEEIEGVFMVTNLDFWANARNEAGDPAGFPNPADHASLPPNIDVYFPSDYDPIDDIEKPHTNLSIGGDARFAKGSAIQMAAGYEGLGKGAAKGGANIIYDIYSMRYGEHGSQALNTIQWIHLIGLDEECNPKYR